MKGKNEGYYTQLKNYHSDIVSDLKEYRFERGDIAEIHIRPGLKNDEFVQAGDTIANIHSFFMDNEITRLENLRNIEKANLTAESSGEKESLILQAEQKYLFAEKQLDLERKNLERNRILFTDSIIPASDFEFYENAFNLAQINTRIAYNEFLALKTGKKAEDISLILKRIESYEREIIKLEQQREHYHIISPLAGRVTFNNETDMIMKVTDTSGYILVIPVLVRNITYLDDLSEIKFSIPGYKVSVAAEFLGMAGSVNMVSNQQSVLAKALIMERINGVHQGMLVPCKVVCDRITLFEYLKRGFRIKT
ncbi:MAG: hypothetical protein JXA03_11390 [Bacteroidales bacterium]|nr:hypothetical protein [Bacteroidales bacterium]